MANRTSKDAHTIKGTNPQYLVEKIIRMRVYDSRYWKEECFALSADLVVDKGMELRFIGGIYGGNIKPTPFLCLILKLLQIQPMKDIIVEFIRQEDFKYVRALGAFYLRLTFPSGDIYKYLEPLYNDYRKLRTMNRSGEFEITHVDEFIDKLLREERLLDIQLPRLQKRDLLEAAGTLMPRVSILEEDLENLSSSDEEDVPTSASKEKRKSRSRSPGRTRRRSRSRSHERSDRTRRSRSRERRARSPEERAHKGKERRRDERRSSKEKSRDTKRTREDSYEREIREANELRARLGLNPLQQ